MQVNEFALSGRWTVTSASITPAGARASISAGFQAAAVYLVMTSTGNTPRTARVLLDGKPIPAADAGADVHNGLVTIGGQRLYALAHLRGVEQHVLTIDVPHGVSSYVFTFG
jgi:hypothetical protein